MILYILRRLVWTLVVIMVVLAITFAVFYLLPNGDPALRFAGKTPTPDSIALVRHRLHLDRAWYVQFGYFIGDFVKGDSNGWPGLGYSYSNYVSVRSEIITRAPRTLLLVFGAAIIWLTLGVSIGVLSAVRRRTKTDRAAMGFALFGISAPVFWLGLMALYVVWNEHLFIPGLPRLTGGTGYTPIDQGVGHWLGHMILPWTVLALLYMAIYARLTRNNLLETLGEDYIRTARAKGLTERKVILKHGLRASLTPIVTIFGLDLGGLLGGAILTEATFSLQGLGKLSIDAIGKLDLPVIMGVVILGAIFLVIANIIVDVLYAVIDPRVRYS
jgi:peptide/nickel transport system permease protein